MILSIKLNSYLNKIKLSLINRIYLNLLNLINIPLKTNWEVGIGDWGLGIGD